MKIVILGGGPAGYAAATAASALGADATVVERERVGGACTMWDAIPSKTLIDAADSIGDLEHAALVGFELEGQAPVMDFQRTLQRVRGVTDHQCNGVAARLANAGVRVVHGEGTLVDDHTVSVKLGTGETTISFDILIVATGARPWLPDFAQHDSGRVITTRTMWHLQELPPNPLVIGAGATGCEMADFFQRAGGQVTLVSSRDRILPEEDEDVAWVVEDAFLMRGMKIHHRARAEGLRVDDDGVTVDLGAGKSVSGSHALFAIGMRANSDGMGLEQIGVKLKDKGGVAVDEYCQTSVSHVYAIGDVTGGVMLANVAAMQGRHAVVHALGGKIEPLRYEAIASTVFTSPEIADVGLTERRAKEENRDVLVVSQPLQNNPRAVIHGATVGLVKIVADRQSGTVLGGSIVGYRASEIIMSLALAVRANLSVLDLAETGAVNPSVSESLQRAAERAAARFYGSGKERRVSSVTFS